MVLDVAVLLAYFTIEVWIGILGSVMIVAAWSYEVWESIKRHKSLIDLRFAGIYLLGTLMLLAYSWALRNFVFVSINAALVVLVLFEIAYTIGWKFGRKTRRRR
jgi:lipid-A-disaccharide synthase-like uncharacterized protein